MKALDKALKALTHGNSLEEKQNRILAVIYLHFEKGYKAKNLVLKGCALKLSTIQGYFRKYHYRLSEALLTFIDDVVEAIETVTSASASIVILPVFVKVICS